MVDCVVCCNDKGVGYMMVDYVVCLAMTGQCCVCCSDKGVGYMTVDRVVCAVVTEQCCLCCSENGVGYMMVEDRGSDIKATLVKSDGSSLYLTRSVCGCVCL